MAKDTGKATTQTEAPTLTEEEADIQQKLRRTAAAEDVKLYQRFTEDGAGLPPLAKTPVAHSKKIEADALLTKNQEHALFRELQRRGAFQYPGMKEGFRDDFGGTLADDKIYAMIRDQGNRWSQSRGWVSGSGQILSFVSPRMKKEEPKDRRGVVKHWDYKVGLFGALFTLFEVVLELQFNAYPKAEILTPNCSIGTYIGAEGGA